MCGERDTVFFCTGFCSAALYAIDCKFWAGVKCNLIYLSVCAENCEIGKLRTITECQTVDIGYSFIVRNPVVDYLSLFGFYDNAKYERVQYGMIDTLTYKTNTGSFAFCAYDKIKECVKKNDNIPDLYNAMNVLRMEYRILKRQGIQHIFQQDIKPYDIAEKAIYRKLIGLFLGFYNGIQKNGRSIIVNTDKELTEKEFNDLIAEKYRQKYTADYECTKQSLIDKGLFSVPTLKRIRQKEKKNRNDFSFSDTNSLIQEIDEKTRLIELQGN